MARYFINTGSVPFHALEEGWKGLTMAMGRLWPGTRMWQRYHSVSSSSFSDTRWGLFSFRLELMTHPHTMTISGCSSSTVSMNASKSRAEISEKGVSPDLPVAPGKKNWM